MKNIFSEVQFQKGKKTLFPMKHDRKFSMNMGELVPILCEEVLPGDTWQCRSEALIRMAPMLAPVMHMVNVQTHYFFVPNRLVWNEWEDFITGGPNGTSAPILPAFNSVGTSWANVYHGTLADYLGVATIPTGTGTKQPRFNALPFRAYQLIYNDYYRDQDLETEIEFSRGSGTIGGIEADTLFTLRKRAWEKDLFTSARPFTQKGAEVEVPLLGSSPVILNGSPDAQQVRDVNGNLLSSGDLNVSAAGSLRAGTTGAHIDPNGTLEADLTSATSTTIADLRNAARLQEHLEKNMRGGSRYIEQMLVHFNVVSDDARLQRPEYLGGGKVPMMISEVLQTSETANTAQGNLSGHGVSAGSSPSWKKFFKEHGYIIGIISVMPKTSYYQGFRRHLLKDDKYDYFWRDFEHIGEQPILNAELYHDYLSDLNFGTFGYNMRYYEYKHIPSSVHGDFKNSLEYWHMGRKFSSLPTLNEEFVKADPTKRVFAVEDDSDKLYCQVYNDVSAIRNMSRFSNPKL